MVVSAIGQRSR